MAFEKDNGPFMGGLRRVGTMVRLFRVVERVTTAGINMKFRLSESRPDILHFIDRNNVIVIAVMQDCRTLGAAMQIVMDVAAVEDHDGIEVERVGTNPCPGATGAEP